MKVLMLCPHPPYPPNSGGRIRQWHQIRYLGARHELTVLCYALTAEEYEQKWMLNQQCDHALVIKHAGMQETNLVPDADLPVTIKGYYTIVMQQALQTLLKKTNFDCAIVENLFMAPYVELFSIPAVLQEYNIESRIYLQYAELPQRTAKERALWKATAILMREYENKIWPAFPLRTVVSLQDKQEMDFRCANGKTVLVENGVDSESLQPLHLTECKRLLFMGTLDYYPNSDAAFYLVKEIMPLVWRSDPSVALYIAGRNPHEAITQLSRDSRIQVIANPPDMREIAKQCCAAVVPMRIGGGTRIKILDSLAMGLPTITTSRGCEGLSVVDDVHLLVRDAPETFAAAAMELIRDSHLRARLSVQGRQLVEQRYSWPAQFTLLDQHVQDLVEAHISV
jgi:glycosyltransferase involved in cell wall biosynthesis